MDKQIVPIGIAVENLLPRELVEDLRGRTRLEVQSILGEGPVLLVRIDEPGGELVQALQGSSTAKGEVLSGSRMPIGFRTVVADPFTTQQSVATRVRDRRALEHRLLRTPHYIVPIRKRAAAERAFSDRVFVGRARSTDIVLRHRSISKSHAWFECDTEGRYLVADAGSKNGTTLNGKLLEPRQAQLVEQGDELRFGKVETTLTYPELLWEMVSVAR